jgi:hypothetical protein
MFLIILNGFSILFLNEMCRNRKEVEKDKKVEKASAPNKIVS